LIARTGFPTVEKQPGASARLVWNKGRNIHAKAHPNPGRRRSVIVEYWLHVLSQENLPAATRMLPAGGRSCATAWRGRRTAARNSQLPAGWLSGGVPAMIARR
jgi:hypothetical protein